MIDQNTPAGLIAARTSAMRHILEGSGIDYCSSKRQSLASAAADRGVDLRSLIIALDHASEERSDDQPDWRDASLTTIVQHLRDQHRHLLLTSLGHAAMLFELVSDPALTEQPAFGTLRGTFHQLMPDLIDHVAYEQRILFPMVEAMESSWVSGAAVPPRFEGGLQTVIERLEKEHDTILIALDLLRENRLRFDLPRSDSTAMRLENEIARCESSLHHCINLENFVLFPRVLTMVSDLYQERKTA